MRTPLQPITAELAVILGTKHSQIRYISWPPQAGPDTCHEGHTSRFQKADTALELIEAALERLDLGTFGLCEACGCEISLKRLDRDPSVIDCAGCASLNCA